VEPSCINYSPTDTRVAAAADCSAGAQLPVRQRQRPVSRNRLSDVSRPTTASTTPSAGSIAPSAAERARSRALFAGRPGRRSRGIDQQQTGRGPRQSFSAPHRRSGVDREALVDRPGSQRSLRTPFYDVYTTSRSATSTVAAPQVGVRSIAAGASRRRDQVATFHGFFEGAICRESSALRRKRRRQTLHKAGSSSSFALKPLREQGQRGSRAKWRPPEASPANGTRKERRGPPRRDIVDREIIDEHL